MVRASHCWLRITLLGCIGGLSKNGSRAGVCLTRGAPRWRSEDLGRAPGTGLEMTSQHTIVVADMWSVTNFGDPNKRFSDFTTHRRDSIKRLVESLVFQDKVVVPTDDYLSLAIILRVFGERGVMTLIDTGALGFVRLKGAVGYVGNGGGLLVFSVNSPAGKPSAFGAPMDEAINWALNGLPGEISRPAITKAAMNATIEIAGTVIESDIRKETLQDIVASSALRSNYGLSLESIERLPGIAANGVRIYGGEEPDKAADEIAALLRLAHANLELRMAEEVGADDLSTACLIGHTLKAKADRITGGAPPDDAWIAFREISDLPDFAEAILREPDELLKLIRLRESRHGEEFRNWFHNHCQSDSIATGREYARLLKSSGILEGPLARVMRFIVTTGLSLKLGDVVGTMAGGADSFIIDRLIRRPSAKIFLQRLEQFKPLSTSKQQR